nr:MAG TPA: hypothetical protein [Caudoviricetes sp.]
MNAEEMFDGEVIRAKYIVEHYIKSGITTWIYIPEEKEENKMSETNLEHYKEDLKGILLFHFDSPRAVIKLIREKFGCQIKVEKYATDAILEWMAQPYKEPILDEVEREYLAAVIRPFKKHVCTVCKKYVQSCSGLSYEYIVVKLSSERWGFPKFIEGTMYKGMELDKEYSLEELGL